MHLSDQHNTDPSRDGSTYELACQMAGEFNEYICISIMLLDLQANYWKFILLCKNCFTLFKYLFAYRE